MMSASANKKVMIVSALAATAVWSMPRSAFAEGEGNSQTNQTDQNPSQPAPAQQGDAWDQAVRQGMQQEGRMTKDQVVEHDKAEQAEADAHEALRKAIRVCAFLGLGGGIGLEHRLENDVQVATGGPEFQIGAGVRKGISINWEFQGRGLFTAIKVNRNNDYASGPFGGSGTTTTDSTANSTGLGLSVDGTARYHFGGITKPFYFGFGGRFDVVSLSGERRTSTRVGSFTLSEAKTTSTTLSFAPMGLVEGGVVLMDSQRVDLSLRLAVGLGVHAGAMVGVAF